MTRERDLLPWIFGGLSAATLAVAVAAVSVHKPSAQVAAQSAAPTVTVAPSQQQAPIQPQPPSLSPTAPTPAPAQSAAMIPVSADTAEQPAEAAQIWECTTNGVKTFSNNPCGAHSSLREVGPINSMSAPAPSRYARAYPEPARYAAPYADPSAGYSNEQEYSDQDASDSAGNSYAIVQGVAFLPRRHPEHHPHRPTYAHRPVAAPRRF